MYSLIDVFNGTQDQVLVDIELILNEIREEKIEVFLKSLYILLFENNL